MKVFVAILFTCVALLTNGCGDDKLDKIEFVDNFEYVQKNIIEFDSLLAYSNYNCRANYSFEFLGKDVAIEDTHGAEDKVITMIDVCPEARKQMSRLKEMTKVLKRNNITAVYRPDGARVSVFLYHYSHSSHMHELREIAVDKKDKGLTSSRVVAAKGKLVLFAPQQD